MSMDKSAIEKIQDLGIQTTKIDNADYPVISLPKDFNLQSLEAFQKTKYRFTGTYTTRSLSDFAEYSKQVNSIECFIDEQSMSAESIFDLGDTASPGHAKHKAVLSLNKTAPFQSVLELDGRAKNQRELAEYLEDWKSYVTVVDVNGDDMELKKAIAAIRRITIESTQKSDHESKTYSGSRSSMEELEASTKDGVMPAWIIFSCTPYDQLKSRDFHLRLSLLTEGAPRFKARITMLETATEEMASEFKELLTGKLKSENAKIYVGNFKV